MRPSNNAEAAAPSRAIRIGPLLLCCVALALLLAGLSMMRKSDDAPADVAGDVPGASVDSRRDGVAAAAIDPHYVDADRLPPLPVPVRATERPLDPGDVRRVPIGGDNAEAAAGNSARAARPVPGGAG